ncbi:MAG: catechol 2,3-dioxygenase-like lactoylglutathione lyase family enzyme [Cocleimonas sp.]|jgi:catechol 2,3-dioxygenase-like lactoylglutathione lyase family enzyme
MTNAYLEHTNLTVKDPDELAALFCRLFDWKIRWRGDALDDGTTVHVGSDDSYLALYTHDNWTGNTSRNHLVDNNLNHLGIVVSDIDELESKVENEGFEPFNHADYDPGRRFYFMIDSLEIEIISYE